MSSIPPSRPEGRPSSPPAPGAGARWMRALGWAAVVAALALVFAAYLRPERMVEIGNRFWSCF